MGGQNQLLQRWSRPAHVIKGLKQALICEQKDKYWKRGNSAWVVILYLGMKRHLQSTCSFVLLF